MTFLDRLLGIRPAGYTKDDRPIFAESNDEMCGNSGAATASAAAGMGSWCCLLRHGHTGHHWYSNPAWLPHNKRGAS